MADQNGWRDRGYVNLPGKVGMMEAAREILRGNSPPPQDLGETAEESLRWAWAFAFEGVWSGLDERWSLQQLIWQSVSRLEYQYSNGYRRNLPSSPNWDEMLSHVARVASRAGEKKSGCTEYQYSKTEKATELVALCLDRAQTLWEEGKQLSC